MHSRGYLSFIAYCLLQEGSPSHEAKSQVLIFAKEQSSSQRVGAGKYDTSRDMTPSHLICLGLFLHSDKVSEDRCYRAGKFLRLVLSPGERPKTIGPSTNHTFVDIELFSSGESMRCSTNTWGCQGWGNGCKCEAMPRTPRLVVLTGKAGI